MERVYERISKKEFCERTQLIQWKAAALLERGKFLPLIYSWTTKKKSNSIACLSPDGELNIMQPANNKMILKSQVRVLLDPYPEFRLIEWNQSETLLLATRSTAVVDVFEAQGMFLYKIQMKDESQGSSQIISQIRIHPLTNNENFSDDVYTLQIDGTLSSFRIDKQAYHRLFTVTLNASPLCSMAYVPKFNILISSSEFQPQNHSTEGQDFGLSVYRLTDSSPFVECIKETNTKKAWHERIPFLSDKRSIITCLEISPEQKSLMAVTSNGELFWFALPSLRLMQSTSSLDDKIVPTQVSWITEDSFVVLHSNGQISRTSPQNYFLGNYEDRQLNLLENCRRIRTVDDSTTFAITEVRLDNVVSSDENKQRVGAELSLFFFFHLSFLLKLLKAFFSFFFGGDATADLSEKVGVEQSAHLTLYTTRNLTLAEYIEKCLAISLAESVPDAYDLDLIYKRQWADLKSEAEITEEHRCVHDGQWVLEECLRLDVPQIQLHGRLLSLAQVVAEGVKNNEKLIQRVQNATKIMNIDAQFLVLTCLLKMHDDELRNYLLLILWSIPENSQPKGYAHFLPYCKGVDLPDGLAFVLEEQEKYKAAKIEMVPQRFGINDLNEEEQFESWSRERAEMIDKISGINDDCNLNELKRKYQLYGTLVKFAGSINLSFQQFCESDAAFIQSTLSKHLIEFADKNCEKSSNQILRFVREHSTRNFDVLNELKTLRPELLTSKTLIDCFLGFELTGRPLIDAMKQFNLDQKLIEVVELCSTIPKLKDQTFADFHSASLDAKKARDLIGKFQQSDLPAARLAPFHLVVDLSGTAESAKVSLLKQNVFEELIVEKSQQYLDLAMPDLNDANLRRAIVVLDSLRTGSRLPRLIATQKRQIDVKTCADLAKLLELSTPAARALANCATTALERKDTNTLGNYVKQLAKSARDFVVVYEMAKKILERDSDDEDLQDDALACLIHNCPEDDLNVVFELLAKHRNRKSERQIETNVKEQTTPSMPDPNYIPIQQLYNFDSQPFIPEFTHQTDVILAVEGDLDALERVHANADLHDAFMALKHLQETGVHPFILQNLQERHLRQIANRSEKSIKIEQPKDEDADWDF
ncbi:Sec39 domain-containing protein [Aphelenchoides besseyi]|nr:Sec39 domain-containing protein [Aphelenchoides besseyi]